MKLSSQKQKTEHHPSKHDHSATSGHIVQPAGGTNRTRPTQAGNFGSLLFISPPLHRKFIPACLMSGDLWKRFFKAVRSCHKSRRYLRWNARQNISVNCYPVTSKSFAPFSETKKRPAPPGRRHAGGIVRCI